MEESGRGDVIGGDGEVRCGPGMLEKSNRERWRWCMGMVEVMFEVTLEVMLEVILEVIFEVLVEVEGSGGAGSGKALE